MFSIHNWEKFGDVSFIDWLLTFIYSIRLDISAAAYLSVIPLLGLCIWFVYPSKWTRISFRSLLMFEVAIVTFIHAGEINAYPEWNHKLTSRVFMHLTNPDEVVRTADYGMTIWFTIYSILEIVFAWRIMKWLFRKRDFESSRWLIRTPIAAVVMAVFTGFFFLLARGGWQQIPININSAYFSNSHVVNDLSVNSAYYFANSYLVYSKASIDELMPEIDANDAEKIVQKMFTYEREHDQLILKNKRPNVVFVILESWAAEGIGCLSETKGATPNFDQLASEGLLFTNVYSTGGTSEIGNSSIFSGNPAIPEISISIQPEKHRKLRALNEDFQDWGYSTHYMFSGDLKYGNIGGYFMDHGFQDVIDENDFPSGLGRGKLNFYDEDLYKFFIKRINKTKEPFLHCAFTGSTHSPYDQPKTPDQNWTGVESDFMNSVIYADGCIKDFIKESKKQPWFKNTLFVFVADHGHASPGAQSPHENGFYRIPLLLWGEPLKEEWKGKTVDKLGSQTDIAATLMYQMGGKHEMYPWSKDLLNPNAPEFAMHTVVRGYGWITPKGSMAYDMYNESYNVNNFAPEDAAGEIKKAHAYLTEVYRAYKNL